MSTCAVLRLMLGIFPDHSPPRSSKVCPLNPELSAELVNLTLELPFSTSGPHLTGNCMVLMIELVLMETLYPLRNLLALTGYLIIYSFFFLAALGVFSSCTRETPYRLPSFLEWTQGFLPHDCQSEEWASLPGICPGVSPLVTVDEFLLYTQGC